MVRHQVNPPADGWSLTLPPQLFGELLAHLFPGDDDEHGAVLLAGQATGPRGPRLLGRELIPARDGVDYVASSTGYRALSARFVRDAALRARDERLAYLAVHNHGDATSVSFSRTDLASHDRGYPALRQITGQLIGAVVFTPRAAAGDLWVPDGTREPLAETIIVGNNLIRLRPRPSLEGNTELLRHRQAQLFGASGQETLTRLRVAVVGLGGVGSLLVELLARLGVGALVLVDSDRVDETNLPRLVAAEPDDIGEFKTQLAARNATRANPQINLTIIPSRVEEPAARHALTTCDWIFLAADTHAARHWVNATVHQHLIPATQAGVKIPVTRDGDLGQIHAVTRILLPGQGCMWCNGLINPTELAIDMHPDDERRHARYVDEIPAPSVIALNNLAAAEAVNHFMLAATALHSPDVGHADILHRPRIAHRDRIEPRQDSTCRTCTARGDLGRGTIHT